MVTNQYFGWLGRKAEREAKKVLYDVGLMTDFQQWFDAENDIDFVQLFDFPFDEGFAFWPIVQRVCGKQMPPGPQRCGNCVPYSACLSTVDRIATELLVNGESESFFLPFVPYSYGAGRVYVGQVDWPRDGSTGSWQIAADMRFGLLPSDTAGLPISNSEDMQGSADTNHDWMRNQSILDKWKQHAISLTIGEGTEIASFEELKLAVCVKKQPVTIASDWGFVPMGKDSKYGIYVHKQGGSWAHQMHIRAVFAIKGQWFVYVGNQWGEKQHPLVAEGFALGGFVITAELFDVWVKEAECFARGSINGRTYKPNFSFL